MLTRRLAAALKPQLILPLALAAALLVFAFNLGDVGVAVRRLGALPVRVVLLSGAATACYLACKAAQLKLMLTGIGVRIPARSFWLAYAAGELTVTLPLGIFSQNWVLSAAQRVRVGRSSAATVMMVLAEVATISLFLAIVGVPGWPAIRPLAVALLAGTAAALLGLVAFEHKLHAFSDRARHRWARRGLATALELLHGLRELSTPLPLAAGMALATAYLGALTAAFWIIGHGMGVPHLDYLTAATIYAFSLAIILLGAGLFSQIGTVELLGMVTARACGIDYADGLALMLGFRIVWTAAIWLLCVPIVATTWRAMPSRIPASGDHGKKISR